MHVFAVPLQVLQTHSVPVWPPLQSVSAVHVPEAAEQLPGSVLRSQLWPDGQSESWSHPWTQVPAVEPVSLHTSSVPVCPPLQSESLEHVFELGWLQVSDDVSQISAPGQSESAWHPPMHWPPSQIVSVPVAPFVQSASD